MFGSNKIDKKEFYSSLVFVGLLFFVVGFSLGYFVPPTQLPEQTNSSNSKGGWVDSKPVFNQPQSQRKSAFLWGEINSVSKEKDKFVLEVSLDLAKTYSSPIQKRAERIFFVEKGQAKVFEVDEGQNFTLDQKEGDVGFNRLGKGQTIAIRLKNPLDSSEKVLNYESHSTRRVFILRGR